MNPFTPAPARTWTRFLIGALTTAACATAIPVGVHAATAPELPIEHFFKDYAYETITISPAGRYLAVTYPSNGTRNAAIIDMQTMQGKPLTGFSQPDALDWVAWKSEDALLYGMTKVDEVGNDLYNIGSLQRDGTKHVLILDNQVPENAVGTWRMVADEVVDVLPDDPDLVLLSSEAERVDYYSVYRVGTSLRGNLSMRSTASRFPTARHALGPPAGRKCSYLTDHKAQVRVCMTREADGSRRLLYRPKGEGAWQELASFSDENSRILPVGFTDDDQALIVLSNVGRDTDALYVYEPEKKALADVVLEAPKGLDVDEAVFSTYGQRLIAARYYDHESHIVFFDEAAARAHGALEKLFPDSGVALTSMSQDGKKAILLVTSGSEPGTFYLFDNANQRVSEVVRRAPWFKGTRLAVVKSVEFEARDQMRIHGYLTYPAGRLARNLPLIVIPHGGPFGIRDYGGFDPEAQFFANRGYGVLQVNFRGSGGFGTAFRQAGAREWGKKMQDDITDGVEWAIREGIADKQRIAIYGASYGGYAAMMGLVRTPDLFRCGITFAGVSDLDMLLNTRTVRAKTANTTVNISPETIRYWESVVGDRKDEAALRADSPRYNAAGIKAPVLIAHGEDDFTVPYDHATALREALEKAGKKVEFLGVREEGHGFRHADNRIKLFGTIEKFLAQHMASAPAASNP